VNLLTQRRRAISAKCHSLERRPHPKIHAKPSYPISDYRHTSSNERRQDWLPCLNSSGSRPVPCSTFDIHQGGEKRGVRHGNQS